LLFPADCKSAFPRLKSGASTKNRTKWELQRSECSSALPKAESHTPLTKKIARCPEHCLRLRTLAGSRKICGRSAGDGCDCRVARARRDHGESESAGRNPASGQSQHLEPDT